MFLLWSGSKYVLDIRDPELLAFLECCLQVQLLVKLLFKKHFVPIACKCV